MTNILIVGKKSFIGSALNNFLSKSNKVHLKDYSEIIDKKKNYFINYHYIINCTSNKNYVYKGYKLKNDFDYQIAKKIINLNIIQIFLSSRKIYLPKNNIKENGNIKPSCNYSKNKLTTEKKLIKLLKKNVLILRISNLIGIQKKNSKRKLHKTFIDIFFQNIKKGYILKNNNIYKDFISTKKFGEILQNLIKKKATGIYNVSIGQKVYLKDIVNWLNTHNQNKVNYKYAEKGKTNSDCFYLNNQKLMKLIKIKNSLSELKNECKKISKSYFNKK